MNLIYRVWLLMLLCYFPFSSKADGTPIITIFTEQFPPYNYLEEDRIVGINHDIVKRACEIANLRCEFKLYPWQRAMASAQAKRFAGLISTSRLPEREVHFQWVGPLVSSPACFYKLATRDDIHIFDQQQLKEFTVGLHKGDVYEDILQSWGLEENEHYINYSEKFGEILAFKRGKLDLFIASANTIQFHIDNKRLQTNEVKPVYLIKDERLLGNYLALNNALPPSMTSKLQHAIDHMKHNGEIKTIKKQYIPTAEITIAESELILEKRCLH